MSQSGPPDQDGGDFIAEEQEVENLRIQELRTLVTPKDVKLFHPLTAESRATVTAAREAIHQILSVPDRRAKFVGVLGPCSVSHKDAALEYATWLKEQRQLYGDQLELVMRLYFEKPRTTIGWKGLINDPWMDESYDINGGLMLARELATDITAMGVPVGTELLDNMTVEYFSGAMSWGAIGARTSASQLHRQVASGSSYPVGFKNHTEGSIKDAIDGAVAARRPHYFPAINNEGQAVEALTEGNPDTHIILRGSLQGPNYDQQSVKNATDRLEAVDLQPHVMVDCSHGNSAEDPRAQLQVASNLADQVAHGSTKIFGFSAESNLIAGKQSFNAGGLEAHKYGLSTTDACIGLEDTARILETMAEAVEWRRSRARH